MQRERQIWRSLCWFMTASFLVLVSNCRGLAAQPAIYRWFPQRAAGAADDRVRFWHAIVVYRYRLHSNALRDFFRAKVYDSHSRVPFIAAKNAVKPATIAIWPAKAAPSLYAKIAAVSAKTPASIAILFIMFMGYCRGAIPPELVVLAPGFSYLLPGSLSAFIRSATEPIREATAAISCAISVNPMFTSFRSVI